MLVISIIVLLTSLILNFSQNDGVTVVLITGLLILFTLSVVFYRKSVDNHIIIT